MKETVTLLVSHTHQEQAKLYVHYMVLHFEPVDEILSVTIPTEACKAWYPLPTHNNHNQKLKHSMVMTHLSQWECLKT